ncbi:hypothetical protein I0C86_25255 [Plantactinospora sp. S1510]|uniref:Transposase n=1 Tax=Plantactinospora alkalitolerans TaxID=2789879 RepID=A0ABS0H1X6_9ACTN|nr:hypothetical protein [Plantactinospora alkalitolerans]MBF9132233.1 hypothetical protein [Plantactinospora alkalitolerans]
MVGETLRAGLEALAAAAPSWLAGQVDADVVKPYAARIDEWRLPSEQTKRRDLAVQVGNDGWWLLRALAGKRTPDWLWQIRAVEVLRRVWVQQYIRDESGPGVIWRDATTHALPPGRTMLVSPYDTDARHAENAATAGRATKSISARPATTPPPSAVTTMANHRT